jgi:hypothetical protein
MTGEGPDEIGNLFVCALARLILFQTPDLVLNDVSRVLHACGEGDIVQRAGTASYNAMHLRVEADALQFLQRQEVGGADAVWQLYTDAALRAGFSAATPMVSIAVGSHCKCTLLDHFVAVSLLDCALASCAPDLLGAVALTDAAACCTELLHARAATCCMQIPQQFVRHVDTVNVEHCIAGAVCGVRHIQWEHERQRAWPTGGLYGPHHLCCAGQDALSQCVKMLSGHRL